jgi:lysozyme
MIKQRLMAAVLSLSAVGAAGIVAHEGMRRVAYVDPVGVVTVCAGHTKTAKLGQVKTDEECAELLKQDAKHAEAAVRRLVKTPVTQRQFDALTSFVFNVGETSFAKSTLLKKINAFDCWGAGKEFSKWTYAGGQQLPGLVKRRADERKEWESGCPTGNYKVSYNFHNIPVLNPVSVMPRRPNYFY